MQFQNVTKALLCLFFGFSGLSLQAETFAGDTYTFASQDTPVQVSTIVGTAKVGQISFKLPGGVCYKVYIGTSANISWSNVRRIGYDAASIHALFPFGCTAETSNTNSTWVLRDPMGTDSIDPSQYWIVSRDSGGVQVEWSTVTFGVANSKTLTPILSGESQNIQPLANGVGAEMIEICSQPGQSGKQSIYQNSTLYGTTGHFRDLIPLTYNSTSQLTLPYLDYWVYTASSQNGISSQFRVTGQIVNEYALVTVWKYQ